MAAHIIVEKIHGFAAPGEIATKKGLEDRRAKGLPLHPIITGRVIGENAAPTYIKLKKRLDQATDQKRLHEEAISKELRAMSAKIEAAKRKGRDALEQVRPFLDEDGELSLDEYERVRKLLSNDPEFAKKKGTLTKDELESKIGKAKNDLDSFLSLYPATHHELCSPKANPHALEGQIYNGKSEEIPLKKDPKQNVANYFRTPEEQRQRRVLLVIAGDPAHARIYEERRR